jgi:hypothetical protein
VELLIISILNDHTLHDLKCAFHWSRVKRIFDCCNSLLNRSLILFVLHLLFELSSLDLFVSSHISIEDLPLSCFEREVSLNGRISLDTAFFKREVKCLTWALLIVELVSQWLLLSSVVSVHY